MPNTMVRLIRILGVASILLGILLVVSYTISPLRLLWLWYRNMAVPLQIGLGIAGMGLAILIATMLLERFANRSYDKTLRES